MLYVLMINIHSINATQADQKSLGALRNLTFVGFFYVRFVNMDSEAFNMPTETYQNIKLGVPLYYLTLSNS